MDVALVRWPADVETRLALKRERLPRLLLVEPDGEPPEIDDCLEDWVRVPAPEADVHTRVHALSRRARAHARVEDFPVLDDHGLLRHRGHVIGLPPIEARLLAALLARAGGVVSRTALAEVGWPTGGAGGVPGPSRRNVLDVHMLRLRQRIEPTGLRIRTVRSRGYMLDT